MTNQPRAEEKKGEVVKEESMVIQKKMLGELFESLAHAKENNKKVVYTFVPGNLSELILAFDMLPVYPEINALQSGMRKKSGSFIRDAEIYGFSEDVCSYVKCDIGMFLNGNIGPVGTKIPEPDILLLSYTGCFVFMKWFENLKRIYPNARIVMLHTPYLEDGKVTNSMIKYMVGQLKEKVIPVFEEVSGIKYDHDKMKQIMEYSRQAENYIQEVFEEAQYIPSPIDAYFAGVYYIGPINGGFRGTDKAVSYYRRLLEEVRERRQQGRRPLTPEGELEEERFRLVVEGPPNWTNFRDFWKLFYDHGAVIVASTYTRVGGTYDWGFRHDPDKPLESLALYCLYCYTNLNLPLRVKLIKEWIRKYKADGFVVNSIKSCNSFSAGQLPMLRNIEEELGVPVCFIEDDLVDPRYYSHANLKNRLDAFFQMVEEHKKRKRGERVS